MSNLKEYWAEIHRKNNIRYLTGSCGNAVWNSLQITDLIKPDSVILNIGVGLGKCTISLSRLCKNIYVLDICKEAIDRVSSFVKAGWLAENISEMPENYFDLAISHLVTQHMTDDDLENQIKYVIKSLKPDGIFAMQFLTYMTNQNPNQDKCREGTNAISFDNVAEIIKKNNGLIVKTPPAVRYNNHLLDGVIIDAEWKFIHIKRK